MAKKSYPTIPHGLQGWDTELESWRQILQGGPIPLFRPTPAGLFASLPSANQNDDGLAVVVDPVAGVIAVLSDGAVYKKIGTQCATQAPTSGAALGVLETAVNNLLVKLKATGLMA